MNGEELMAKVKLGGVVFGATLYMSRNPRRATPIAKFGLDYAINDIEQSPRDGSNIAAFPASFSFTGVAPIVRVPIPDPEYVTMALDAGAQGVMALCCETVAGVQPVFAEAVGESEEVI